MTGLNEQIKAENKHYYSDPDYAFQLERSNTLDAAKFIREINLITEQEFLNLVDMINSPDRENYNLANMLIQAKHQHYTQNLTQDVSYIQTRESQLSQPRSQ